jgi:hypothetical protein
MYPLIAVTLAGDRSGFIIASAPHPGEEHLAPSARTRMGTTLVVGKVYRVSADEEPEEWKAWLWPVAGGDMRMGQSCEAMESQSLGLLRRRLQKRADQGTWWA